MVEDCYTKSITPNKNIDTIIKIIPVVTKKSRKPKRAKKALFKKDIKAALKIVDFDPTGEEFKFLAAAYDIGDSQYLKLRALEMLRSVPDNKELITIVRLLLLAIHEGK